jgi:recombination protein RecA
MAKPKIGSRKNKDIVSKEIEITPQAKSVGLPADLLKTLAGYGVVPRIEHDKVEMCDTGSLRLNWIMGGGIPRNRVTTLAGVEKSGKTTTATIISRAEIDRGGLVAYFDTENKFNSEWAEELGVDLSRFVFMQVFTGEQLINAIIPILESKVFSGIVIDSVRGTMWDAEDQADAEAQQMGVSGKMWGKFARKVGPRIKTSGAWVLVLNGLYDSMKPGSHEQIEPGGKGVPYLASLRLRTQPLVYGEAEKEITIRVRCVHSQVGRNSKREGEYTVQYVGSKAIVNPLPDLVEMGVEYGVVNKGGAWYSIGDENWQGSLALQKAMQENPELYDHVYDSVMGKIDPNYVPPEKTHVELLGDDHEDLPLDVDEDTGEIVGGEVTLDLFDEMLNDNEWVDPMGE